MSGALRTGAAAAPAVPAPEAPVPPRTLLGAEPVGRAVEIAALQQFVDEDQQDPVLLLAGPRGSGRTALLRWVHRTRGDRTVLVRSTTASAPWAWTGLSLMLNAIGLAVPDLGVGETGAERPDGVDALQRTMRLVQAVGRAPLEPVVLVIDDLDLQDEQSQSAVALLAGQLAGTPLRILASTVWPSVGPRFADLPVLRLDPLPADELRRATDRLSARPLDAVTADLLVEQSGGLPGVFVRRLARLTPAQREGRTPLTLPMPAAYPEEADRVAHRFALEPGDLQVLRRIAAAPIVSVEALPALLDGLHHRLEPLVARGLVARESGYVSMPQPELRSLLHWRGEADDRVEAHRRGAGAEERSDPDLRDWHLSHVEPGTTASSTLYAAATSLLQKGLVPAAVELAERALALAGSAGPVAQRLEFVRELLLHEPAASALRHLPRLPGALGRRQQFQRLSLELVVGALTNPVVRTQEVDALVGRYRHELRDESADLLALTGVLQIMSGAIEDGVQRLRSAEQLGPTPTSAGTLRFWTARLRAALAGPGTAGVVRAGAVPPEADVVVRMTASLALMFEERHEAAREGFAAVMPAWRSARSSWGARARLFAVENELLAGNMGRAVELASGLRDSNVASPHAVYVLAWAALAAGRADDAERMLRTPGPLQAHRLVQQAAARLLGASALLRGDPGEAVTRLRTAVEEVPGLSPAVLRGHPDLIEALWRVGDVIGARLAVERFAVAAHAGPSRWAEAALARCRALLEEDVADAFGTALARFEDGEAPYERARTHALFGAAAERAGLYDAAAEQRAAALDAYGRIGATAWLRLLRSSPSTARRPAAPDLPLLSDTELAVLRMARRGAHNREIASALFMSLRTVELRLTGIYRKFGARSRTHLFSMLPDGWPEEPRRSPAR